MMMTTVTTLKNTSSIRRLHPTLKIINQTSEPLRTLYIVRVEAKNAELWKERCGKLLWVWMTGRPYALETEDIIEWMALHIASVGMTVWSENPTILK